MGNPTSKPLMTAAERRRESIRNKAAETKKAKAQAELAAIAERKQALLDKEPDAADKVTLKKKVKALDRKADLVTRSLGLRGGAKPGAGRPVGVPNKVTANFRDEYLRSGKKTPIEFLLDVMNDEPRPRKRFDDKEEDEGVYEHYLWNHKDRCIAAAIQVAPYIHPKLSSVEVGGHIGIS